jgi:hypothetical protein
LFFDDLQIKDTLLEGTNLTVQEATNFFFDHLNALFCAFWVAVDEAFDKALGKKNPKGNTVIDDFRAII